MALVLASEIGDLAQVKLLVHSCEGNETIPPRIASPSIDNEDLGMKITSKLGFINAVDIKRGRTALIAAVSQGHYAVCDFLLQNGADPSVKSLDGVDALMLACLLHGKKTNHSQFVQLLLHYGASLQNVDKKFATALHICSKKGCGSSVKLLLGKVNPSDPSTSPDINAVDIRGATPLMYACAKGYSQIVGSLCAAGANVNMVDLSSSTALHWAARTGKSNVIDSLVQAGIALEAKDQYNLSAVEIAAAHGHFEFVQDLLQRHVTVKSEIAIDPPVGSEMRTNPRTALLLASSNGKLETFHLLLSHKIAQQNSMADTTRLAEELLVANHLAILGCHNETHNFISSLVGLQSYQAFKSKHTADEDKFMTDWRNASKQIKFRRRCLCSVCTPYYLVESTDTINLNPETLSGRASPERMPTLEPRNSLSPAQVTCHDSAERAPRISNMESKVSNQPVDDHDDASDREEDFHSNKAAADSRKSWSHRRERRFIPLHVFDPRNHNIRSDILRIIGAYLQGEGLVASAMTLEDEASIELWKQTEMSENAKMVCECISRGQWANVNKSLTKPMLGKNFRRFLYQLQKQEYLEMISRGENERAFGFLHKKLKPLESQSKVTDSNVKQEFADLCYLLTCKSVQDATSFRDWDMAMAREMLAETFKSMVSLEFHANDAVISNTRMGRVEHDRLVHLLQQAVTYQLEYGSPLNTGAVVSPQVDTLLEDYESVAIPRHLFSTFVGHTYSVKCVKFVGEDGRWLASGSSDRTIALWRTQEDLDSDTSDDEENPTEKNISQQHDGTGDVNSNDTRKLTNQNSTNKQRGKDLFRQVKQRGPERIMVGHKSRVWDIASDRAGRYLASASGDNIIRVWNIWSCLERQDDTEQPDTGKTRSKVLTGAKPFNDSDAEKLREFEGINTAHEGDIYSLEFDHSEDYICTCGYDKTVRLTSIPNNTPVKIFKGHTSAVTQVRFNPSGNLIVSGSKDSTVKFWDVISGVCVRTFTQPIGEITSVDISKDGLQLLTNSKDGTIRLWDIRTGKPLKKFRGHQNSSLNFIRSIFGPRDLMIFGGSEDGKVHMWDTQSGNLLAKLRGHTGPIFHTAWSTSQSLLASCSEDGTVRTWRAY